MKKPKVGDKVEVYAGFPNDGSFYSGEEGTVTSLQWKEKDEIVEEFVTVRLDGSGDILCVHPKQLNVLKKPKLTEVESLRMEVKALRNAIQYREGTDTQQKYLRLADQCKEDRNER